jgi:hypothetical protein
MFMLVLVLSLFVSPANDRPSLFGLMLTDVWLCREAPINFRPVTAWLRPQSHHQPLPPETGSAQIGRPFTLAIFSAGQHPSGSVTPWPGQY